MLTVITILFLSMWLGVMVYNAGVAAPRLFKTFPKVLAGDINTVLFPGYYAFSGFCGTIAVLALLFSGWQGNFSAWLGQLGLLITLLAANRWENVSLRPKTSEAWEKFKDREDDPAVAEHRKRFGKLHGIAMSIALVKVLTVLALVFWILGPRLN